MNDLKTNSNHLDFQAKKLQGLIKDIIQCCENRKLYEISKFEIPFAELKCLLLFEGARYLTVKTISQRMDVAKSRITILINGLKKKGFVEIIDDPEDARIKLIRLTNTGSAKLNEIMNYQMEIHKKLLLTMDENERKNVINHMEILRMAMEIIKKEL
ncbi:MAG: MarR family transcriptional regulator [Desulfobacterales bacterium]|nr:MarR family transcriptional regulator [Desulfobacterales bacterium]